LVEEPKDKDKKPKATNIIEFVLKQQAGSTATAPTYELKVTRFCEGTAGWEWIDLRKAIVELWRQNGISNTQDRVANVSTIMRRDLLTSFREKIKVLTTLTNNTGETVTVEITDETVSVSLNAIAQMVFPFRALETQRQWMRCCMQKPKELSIWKIMAAVRKDLITVFHSFLMVRN
jgi:hypothetical protein